MYVSDFTNAKSMHDFMLHLFCTETGLAGFGPTPQQVQYDALVMIKPNLKEKLIAPTWNDKDVFSMPALSSLSISQNQDAQLFVSVLKKVQKLNEMAVDQAIIVRLGVYPFMKPMIESNAALTAALRQAYVELINRFPPKSGLTVSSPLALRIKDTIEKSFGLTGFCDPATLPDLSSMKIANFA